MVCHSDMERTGWFECSDRRVNRLHENIVWSMRGNFLDVPTDCPQRDERLGWTGDIQVFAPTASFLYDCDGFLASWLADLAADQYDVRRGAVGRSRTSCRSARSRRRRWGDAAVIVPWVLYERYGDAGVLAAQYDSMRRLGRSCRPSSAGESRLWDTGFQFGDWLDPGGAAREPARGAHRRAISSRPRTSPARRSCCRGRRRSWAAPAMRRDTPRSPRRCARRSAASTSAPSGRLVSDAPTAYALALRVRAAADASTARARGRRLARLVHHDGYRIATGFVGTPLICDALCAHRPRRTAAYRLLMERACPSWLYPVTMGATTIWERWDSMLPDGSVNPGEMTSFNHYALGAVGDWLHRTVAGLAPAEPGYRRIDDRAAARRRPDVCAGSPSYAVWHCGGWMAHRRCATARACDAAAEHNRVR